MSRDPREHVAEIGKRVLLVPAARRNQAREYRRDLATPFGLLPQPVFASHGDRTKLLLGAVVVDPKSSIFQESYELRPVPKHVGDGLPDRTLGQHDQPL